MLRKLAKPFSLPTYLQTDSQTGQTNSPYDRPTLAKQSSKRWEVVETKQQWSSFQRKKHNRRNVAFNNQRN